MLAKCDDDTACRASAEEFPPEFSDVFVQSKAPEDSLEDLGLPAEEVDRIEWLRARYALKDYSALSQAVNAATKPDPHTLVYASMAVRDQSGASWQGLQYLYQALKAVLEVKHPYLKAIILNQIAMDTYGLTGNHGLAKAIAAEAVRVAPNGRFRAWSAWTTLAELILLEATEGEADLQCALRAADGVFADLQDQFDWRSAVDFCRYLRRQLHLAHYRESEYFQRRFPELLDS